MTALIAVHVSALRVSPLDAARTGIKVQVGDR